MERPGMANPLATRWLPGWRGGSSPAEAGDCGWPLGAGWPAAARWTTRRACCCASRSAEELTGPGWLRAARGARLRSRRPRRCRRWPFRSAPGSRPGWGSGSPSGSAGRVRVGPGSRSGSARGCRVGFGLGVPWGRGSPCRVGSGSRPWSGRLSGSAPGSPSGSAGAWRSASAAGSRRADSPTRGAGPAAQRCRSPREWPRYPAAGPAAGCGPAGLARRESEAL